MTETHTMHVHTAAAQTLAKMGEQVAAVAETWGRHDPALALSTAVSCARQTTMLASTFFGDTSHITRDGDLSLFVRTSSGYVYGVIFHRAHRADAPLETDVRLGYRAPVTGRYCVSAVAGGYCLAPFTGGRPTCTGHDPAPFALPIPGEWSFHS